MFRSRERFYRGVLLIWCWQFVHWKPPIDFNEGWFHSHIMADFYQKGGVMSGSSSWRNVTISPFLQKRAWLMSNLSPQTQCVGNRSRFQLYRICMASQNCCLLRSYPHSLGRVVNQFDTPLSALDLLWRFSEIVISARILSSLACCLCCRSDWIWCCV